MKTDPDLADRLKLALRNAAQSFAGPVQQDVAVIFKKPSKSTGVNVFQNLAVDIILTPTEQTLLKDAFQKLEYWAVRGYLQAALLTAVTSTRGINNAFALSRESEENVTLPPEHFRVEAPFIPQTYGTAQNDTGVAGVQLQATNSTANSSDSGTAREEIDNLRKRRPDLVMAVHSLFWHFGTHVCPHVLLGGWWKLTASMQSNSTFSLLDMSNILSNALFEAESRAYSASASGAYKQFAATGSGGRSRAEETQEGSTDAARDINQEAFRHSTVSVVQEWKGGASGTSPGDWRRSLDSSFNSNWRIIDREVDRCLGVWTWMPSDRLKLLLCTEWLEEFLPSLIIESNESIVQGFDWQGFCQDPAGLASLRETVRRRLQEEQEAARRREDARRPLNFNATRPASARPSASA